MVQSQKVLFALQLNKRSFSDLSCSIDSHQSRAIITFSYLGKSQSLFYDKSLLRYILLFNIQEIGNGSGIVNKQHTLSRQREMYVSGRHLTFVLRRRGRMVLSGKQRGSTHFFFSTPITVQQTSSQKPFFGISKVSGQIYVTF